MKRFFGPTPPLELVLAVRHAFGRPQGDAGEMAAADALEHRWTYGPYQGTKTKDRQSHPASIAVDNGIRFVANLHRSACSNLGTSIGLAADFYS